MHLLGTATLLLPGCITEQRRLVLCKMLPVSPFLSPFKGLCVFWREFLGFPPPRPLSKLTEALCMGCMCGVCFVPLVIQPVGAGLHYGCSEWGSVENISKSLSIVRDSRQLCQLHSFLPKCHHGLRSPTVH